MWDCNVKLKQFKDPVHGYIPIPSTYCEELIDTKYFQRLRGIEQTSMRPLFPAARHDRFIHSLGVFHLACLAFHFLKKNTSPDVLDTGELDKYKDTFLIAALMHDCGHAPFSHLFEGYYNNNKQARTQLLKVAGEEFCNDYKKNSDDNGSFSGAPHEEFSAYVLLKFFPDLNKLFPHYDPVLAARMITGCTHNKPGDNKGKRLEDCLIKLINGDTIDVDKLDYIIRDTWASGVNNVTVDIHRLLGAIELVASPRCQVVYNKSALSVIQNVINGRNFLYRWIYTHHTVLYYNHLLKQAIEEVKNKLSDSSEQNLLDKIFSSRSFEKHVEHKTFRFYLPCDADIYYLMKQFINDIPEIDEIISRSPAKIPLWKTYAEFKTYFNGKTKKKISHIKNRAQEYLSEKLGIPEDDFLVLSVKAKYVEIEEGQLLIKLSNSNFEFYNELTDNDNSHSNAVEYFYLYIPREIEDLKDKCIEILKNA